MNKKTIGIGIVFSLFLITSANAYFWDDWVSTRKLESNYFNSNEILLKENEAVKEAFEAKKKAVQAYNEAITRQNMALTQKFSAHCLLYSQKKMAGEELKDARVEPACANNSVDLYKRLYHENFSTVSEN